MKIISFFSDPNDTQYYSVCADIMIKDCKRLQLDYHIENLRGQGSYRLNCKMKPAFILDCLKKFKVPLMWVDCDSRIFQKPEVPGIETRADYAGVKRNATGDSETSPIMIASSLFFNTTKASFDLLEKWKSNCELKSNHAKADHAILLDTISSFPPDSLRYEWLPDSFGRIYAKGFSKEALKTAVIVANLAPTREVLSKKGTL